jgi:hypothetical protein
MFLTDNLVVSVNVCSKIYDATWGIVSSVLIVLLVFFLRWSCNFEQTSWKFSVLPWKVWAHCVDRSIILVDFSQNTCGIPRVFILRCY